MKGAKLMIIFQPKGLIMKEKLTAICEYTQ